MPKGDFKRRAAGSQFPKQRNDTTYMTAKEEENDRSSVPDLDLYEPHPSTSSGPNLRPRPPSPNRENGKFQGNRIINMEVFIEAINNVFQEHLPVGHCNMLELKVHSERKVGLGSDIKFGCMRCRFVSQTYRTYTSCIGKNRGASINMLLASGLQDTSIGVEKANLLLASMDIPPPSRSHLQNLVTEAAENTVKLNEEDMAEKRKLVVNQNKVHGASDPYQMDMSFDCRYNANRMVSSYKPGQAASQAYGVAIENHTSYKYIVGLAVENKLCWTGAYLRNQGYDIQCPGEHVGCTANLEYMEPHSERRMAHDLAKQMHNDDIIIRTLTTDGDTKSFLGVQDFYDNLGSVWNVSRQSDPNHLGSAQLRRVKKANWSKDLFPGKTNKKQRDIATTAFARDIKSRCGKIIAKLRSLGNGDLRTLTHLLPEICSATVECYSGNCSFCPHNTLVCDGIGGPGSWWYESEFLPTHDVHSLKMTENDRELLRNLLEIRLSERAVLSVSSNTTTQKCEAFNRGALSSLPKETNYSRNFAGRLASKTLQLNNDIESSVNTKVETITGVPLSDRSSRYLKYCSQKEQTRKSRQKSPNHKTARCKNRARMENEYSVSRASGKSQQEYSKGMLDMEEYCNKDKH